MTMWNDSMNSNDKINHNGGEHPFTFIGFGFHFISGVNAVAEIIENQNVVLLLFCSKKTSKTKIMFVWLFNFLSDRPWVLSFLFLFPFLSFVLLSSTIHCFPSLSISFHCFPFLMLLSFLMLFSWLCAFDVATVA